MHVVVCVKAVPDPKQASRLAIDPMKKTVIRQGVPLVINPLDRHALQAAVELGGTVTAMSMGPPEAREALQEALARGAGRGVLLSDRAFAGADTLATAHALAAAVGWLGAFDLILCGSESSDGGTAQVGPQLAELLGIPHVSFVTSIEADPASAPGNHSGAATGVLRVKAKDERGRRRLEVRLPALLTVSREANRPGGLSFAGVVQARRKPLEVWDLATVGVPVERIGAAGSPTRIGELRPTTMSRAGRIIGGTLEEAVRELAATLKQAGILALREGE